MNLFVPSGQQRGVQCVGGLKIGTSTKLLFVSGIFPSKTHLFLLKDDLDEFYEYTVSKM